MDLRSIRAAIGWRLRPARFDDVALDVVPLDTLAREVPDLAALASTESPNAFVELAGSERIAFAPHGVTGSGEVVPVPEAGTAPPLRIYRFNTPVRIFGKGLFVQDGAVLRLPEFEFCELGRFDYPAHEILMQVRDGRAAARMPSRTHVIDGPCVYLAQCGETIWGHWLVDLMPRLTLIRGLPATLPIVIDADAPPFAAELLAAAGIARSRIVRHDKFRYTLRARDVYVPSFLRYGDAMSSCANAAWGPAGPGDPGRRRKLHLSRAGFPPGSTLTNHLEVETRMRQRGFDVIHPETLGLREKIAVFGQARQIVGEFGSGMHNSVFAPAGTRVCVLQSTSSTSYLQLGLGAIRDQPTSIAFGPARQGGRDFTLPRDVLDEALDRLDDDGSAPTTTR